MALAPARRADLDPAALALATRDTTRAPSLTFLVDDDVLHYRVVDGQVEEGEQREGAVVVRLGRGAWADLVGQVRTIINLHLSGEIAYETGGFEDLMAWDRTLRYLHAGIPPYDAGRVDLAGRDPRAILTLADDDEELRAQLAVMGFLLVKGVFTPQEMAEVDAEVDRLAALARPGDEQSWWVGTDDGERVCRLVYASLRSEVLRRLEQDPRLERLGRLLDPAMRPAPDRLEGTAVLIKVPGRTSGLSNIPWHQDCGMGGHSVLCPALSLGVQITGSSAETGNLLMVPGSHGQSLAPSWHAQDGVLVVAVDTEPGDVTVHVQDVMHASPAPTERGGRRTLYTTWYPPTVWEHVGPGEAFNDLVRNRTGEVAALA